MAKVLIVEDNVDLATLYQRALGGQQAIVTGTAWDAIAMLEKHQELGLVILDMHLPEVSGMVVLEHIRRLPRRSQLKVFVVSADDNMRPKAELIGIDLWMTKPVDLDILIDRVEKALPQAEEAEAATQPTPAQEATLLEDAPTPPPTQPAPDSETQQKQPPSAAPAANTPLSGGAGAAQPSDGHFPPQTQTEATPQEGQQGQAGSKA